MATNTTPEYDFDNWTDEDDTKALAALKPDVRHIIVENQFIGRFTDGEIIKLPFSLTVDDINDFTAASDNPVDQLGALLTKIGGEEAAKLFTSHDITEAMILADKFFTLLARKSGASLPE